LPTKDFRLRHKTLLRKNRDPLSPARFTSNSYLRIVSLESPKGFDPSGALLQEFP
jgi:hypothetical protein